MRVRDKIKQVLPGWAILKDHVSPDTNREVSIHVVAPVQREVDRDLDGNLYFVIFQREIK